MVSDREPRYQLLDSNGTVVGSLYEKSNGKLALQDGNTDTEVVFDGDTIGSGGESLDIDSLASGLKVLDLVDSASGNTVYDSSTETLGDGNQDVNANSVSTDEVDSKDAAIRNSKRIRENVSGGDTVRVAEVLDSNTVSRSEQLFQITNNVGTSATTIITVDNEPLNGLMIVSGQDGNNNRFADLMQVTRNTAPQTINKLDDLGTPASRTYSNSGPDIQLEMGSDSYNVEARVISVGGS